MQSRALCQITQIAIGRALSEKVFTQSNSNLLCRRTGWVFRIDSLLGHVGQTFDPLVATKLLEKVVSNHYLRKYSCNPIQTCMYTYWVSVQIWFTFGQLWPKFGPLLAKQWLKMMGFWPLSEKVFMQSNSNLVSAQNWFAFGPCWPTTGHKMTENVGFQPLSNKSTIMWNNDYLIYFKHGAHTGERHFHEWLHRPNLASLVAISVFSFHQIRL